MVVRSNRIGTAMEQCCRQLAQVEINVDVLDSELSSLDAVGQQVRPRHGHVRMRKGLTARTRNSEVLPAFCSPIMVMSISVALDGGGG
jgi:hypothetical protein